MKILHLAECAGGVERYLQMLLPRLEKKGLICTCIDEKDSRIHHLQLTDECKPILKIIDEEIGKINKTLFNDVSVEEMKSLKQTMSKLQKCVEERK